MSLRLWIKTARAFGITHGEVSIADTDLKAGDTKLHINFSADERLLAYAKDENVDFNMTVSIQQYPQDKTFDFEGGYMRRLTIPLQFTKKSDKL